MDKPVICALNGPAAGYGMDLALGCDMRIASENARLHAVFGKRNVVPESGGCWYLPRIVGWAKAAEVAFVGRADCLERSARPPGDDFKESLAAFAERRDANFQGR